MLTLGCRHHEEVIPIPDGPKRMTVVVYMVAENTLEKYGSLSNRDVAEMLQASKKIPLDCNLVVYRDGVDVPEIFTINCIEGKSNVEVLTERNSCDPEVFKSNLQYIISKYPAKQYGLVMWSHGSGWIPSPRKTIGVDNNFNSNQIDSGSELEISDMSNVLQQLGIKWEYILFDACFMQCVETAYELRDLTKYIIASPAEIPGEGAPYNIIMPYLMQTTSDNIKDLAEEYYKYYNGTRSDGLVISAVKTDELDSLLRVTRKLIPDFYEAAPSYSMSDVQKYCIYHDPKYYPEYYDMGSVMKTILNASDYTEWTKQMHRAIPYRYASERWYSEFTQFGFYAHTSDVESLSMMSVFVPNIKYNINRNYNEDIKKTLWYKDFMAESK